MELGQRFKILQHRAAMRAELQVNDVDRHHYATHALTLAQHPSETDERLMVRLLAFALNAAEAGLSTLLLDENAGPGPGRPERAT